MGLSKAVGTAEDPTQECISGGLHAYTVLGQQLPGVKWEIFFPVFQDVKESRPFLQPFLPYRAQTAAPRAHDREQIPPQQIPCQQQLPLGTAWMSFLPPQAWPWRHGVSAGTDTRGRRRSRGQQRGNPKSCPCKGPSGKPWLQPSCCPKPSTSCPTCPGHRSQAQALAGGWVPCPGRTTLFF